MTGSRKKLIKRKRQFSEPSKHHANRKNTIHHNH